VTAGRGKMIGRELGVDESIGDLPEQKVEKL
jgi:hypothetical protein